MAVKHNDSDCEELLYGLKNISRKSFTGITPSIEMYEAVLIISGFGIFAALLASGFRIIRSRIYLDRNSLDVAFDAGGKVNIGLTATSIVSQWTWAATLLQSSTVASKYGISGPFWYAAGATIQILLFAMLSVQLKIRAPGAKTFLQVIKARFGSVTHKTFCVFALMTNVIVTAMLMLGGAAVMTSLIKDISLEYSTMLVAAVIGAYTFIGGLGATFYVSYFNTGLMYIIMIIFLIKVYGQPDNDQNPLGSIEKVYRYLKCSKGPEGNEDGSFITMVSNSGLMFGLINIVGNFGTVFVDQSYWQSSVAAKPKQGVLGFLLGGLTWFAIPFALATTTGLAYIALSAQQDAPLLVEADVDAGLVPPVVAQRLLGRSGEILITLMILMAVTSTGSAEVMAVTSIFVYDIYQLYLKPYRMVLDANSCILCGKGRGRMANPRDKCICESMTNCSACKRDDRQRESYKRALKPEYNCAVHGPYRKYTDYLLSLKNWCLLWTTVSIVPLTIILNLLQLSLGWLYLFMGILIGSAVLPIALAMTWDRLTSVGMIAGSVGGTSLAIISWLVVASTYDGGLFDFFRNTGREVSMLCGNLVSILSSGLITVVVSLVLSKYRSFEASPEIWENTRDIDSPLNPWTELYAKELNLSGVHQLDNRPSLEEVARTFRNANIVAQVGALSLSVILIILWPALMIPVGVMSYESFFSWVTLSEAWAVIATLFILIAPVVNEAWDIYHAFKSKRKISSEPNLRTNMKHSSIESNASDSKIRINCERSRNIDTKDTVKATCSGNSFAFYLDTQIVPDHQSSEMF